MKNTLFLALLAVAFLASACSDDPSSSNSLVAPGTTLQKTPEMIMNLDLAQAALIDEMTYLQEDMSVLLNPSQLLTFNTLTTSLSDDRDPRRLNVDMAAVAWLNLIYKANPNLGRELLAELRALIAASAARRAEIIKSGATREEIAAQLKAEHEALMAAINAKAGATAVTNAEKLRSDLELRRKELQEKMEQLRIDREVARMKAALGLTDEQAAAVAAILKIQHDQLKALREKYKENPEGFKAELQEILASIDRQMRGAIGNELWEKWLQLRRGTIKPVDPVSPIDMQVAELTRLLGLNPTQAGQLKELLLAQQAQLDGLMKDPTTDRRLLAEKMAQIKKEYDAKIIALLGLTPEQVAQYNRWRGIKVVVDPVDPLQQQVDHLTKLLGLNPTQAAQLKDLLRTQQAQIDQLMKDPTTDRNALAEKIAQIKKEYDAMIIKQLGLTDAQIAQYNRWRGINVVVDPVDPMQQQVDHLTKLLGLNPDQSAELKSILISQQQQINALMKDPTTDRRTLTAKIEEIKKATDAAILGIVDLTEEQKALYLKWKTGSIRPGTGG